MARPVSTALTRGYLDRLLSIGASWPADPLRPDMHFGRAIELASRKALLKPSPPSSTSSSTAAAAATEISSGAAAAEGSLVLRELNSGTGSDVERIERATAALEALRANKFLKRHPTSRSLTKPASNPDYYVRLVNTLEKAGRGEDISPSWQEQVSRFFGRV
ncbi:hypothetical protein V8E36_001015 [Tilletia maclaganii]